MRVLCARLTLSVVVVVTVSVRACVCGRCCALSVCQRGGDLFLSEGTLRCGHVTETPQSLATVWV